MSANIRLTFKLAFYHMSLASQLNAFRESSRWTVNPRNIKPASLTAYIFSVVQL
jgi:hypothetical protein